ncbi:RCC1 domain-containing protein [Cohnella fermenti]|uniref:SbsA Ig-like domain-containing protein n=1 Tax=Cohnella fermenti TaxID=2565925 RepID=A0A4S4BG84_9BACL|nr:Ig-like domain-containing protein [Cohnella fermenti]THF73413.1 hypothetical protein E6C55_29405 [Cohnella fermenti]
MSLGRYYPVKVLSLWLSLALLMSTALSGSHAFSAAESGPLVLSTAPADQESNVAIDRPIVVTFDETVQQGNNFSLITLYDQNKLAQVPVATSIDGHQLTLSPEISLSYGTAYKAYVPSGSVQSANGIILQNSYVIEFVTLAEPLSVASMEPSPEAEGVVLDRPITMAFNLPLDSIYESRLNLTAGLIAVPFFVEIQDNLLILQPLHDLEAATSYTVSLGIGSVTASNGQTLQGAYASTFTTGTVSESAMDVPALQVIRTTPSDREEDVELGVPITVDFNTTVQEGPSISGIRLKKQEEEIPYSITINGTRLTIIPDQGLEEQTYYTVILPTDAVLSEEGSALEAAYRFGFRTEGSMEVVLKQRLSAGDDHTLYLDADGTVWAWGVNRSGQLGDGTTTSSRLPIQVLQAADGEGRAAPLDGVISVSGGGNYSAVLRADGTVWTWGGNRSGQLGDGTTNDRSVPVQVVIGDGVGGLSAISSLSGGMEHIVALASDGTVWSWGANEYGQLGNATFSSSGVPVQVLDASDHGALSGIVAIAAGAYHSLALKADGTVWSWGLNSHGQLGDGSTVNRSLPVQAVSGNEAEMLANAIAVDGGSGHSIALLEDGTVWAWGANDQGQLGDGSKEDRLYPVQVKSANEEDPLSSIVAVGSGATFSTALTAEGTVWTWGDNAFGQLGDGTSLDRDIPVQVTGDQGAGQLTGVTRTSAGGSHVAVMRDDHSIWSWGLNEFGQLGNDTDSNYAYPVELVWSPQLTVESSYPEQNGTVSTLTPTLTVTFNYDIQQGNDFDRVVLQYGDEQVALEQTIEGNQLQLTPVEPLLPGAVYELLIPEEAVYSEEIDTTDETYTSLNLAMFMASLGNEVQMLSATTSSTLYTLTFTTVAGTTESRQLLDAGYDHTLLVKLDGSVWATGSNTYGQLGDGTTTNQSELVRVRNSDGTGYLSDVYSVSTGLYRSLAVKTDGTVWSWGYNSSYGALGNGSTTNSPLPVQVVGSGGTGALNNVIAVSAGYSHSLALKADGTVWSWGNNVVGMLGNATLVTSKTPVQVVNSTNTGGLTNVIAISAGYDHSLTLLADGTVWSWGNNDYGQLGTNSIVMSTKPVQVKGTGGTGVLSNIIAIEAGNQSSFALASDGTVWSWGNNYYGKLGDGTMTTRKAPVQVLGIGGTGVLSGVIAISTGYQHSVALKSDGTIYAWGFNNNGQLGNNTKVANKSPVQVVGINGTGIMTGVCAISAGQYFVVAITNDGVPWGWGNNDSGQLGDGTTTASLYPVSFINQEKYHYFYSPANQVTEFSYYKGINVYRRLYTYDLNGNLINTTTAQFTF